MSLFCVGTELIQVGDGSTCLLPKTWRQTIVSAHMIFAGSPFVRTSRLVIDMTMRKAKHLDPCSMRDLVMLQTSSLTASYSHHTLRQTSQNTTMRILIAVFHYQQ